MRHLDVVTLFPQLFGPFLGEGLLKEPWKVTDGHIELSTRPGLGFNIDEKEAEQDCGRTGPLACRRRGGGGGMYGGV